MIKLKITTEAVTDIFTPGIIGGNTLVEGLPENVKLVGVVFDGINGMVEYTFDDGKAEESTGKIKYIKQIS